MKKHTFRRWLYRGRRPNWIARLMNRLDAVVSSTGIIAKYGAVTLDVVGRTSGRTISLPLVMVVVDGERYLASMLGDDVQWVKNVRAANGHAVLRGGRREEVRLEEVPATQRAPILRVYLQHAPGARAHIPVDKDAPLSAFDRIAPAYPVFHVVSAARTRAGLADGPEEEAGMKLDANAARPVGMVGLLRRLGGTFVGVWLIKHVLSPLDRRLYRWTGGRGIALGRPLAPRLLLTTMGRKTGREHTVPVFYLRDGERLVVCNVNPGFEHPNPWTLNLRATPRARVQLGSTSGTYHAREATAAEIMRYWPQFVRIWPAYQAFDERGGKRTFFVLEPDRDAIAAGRRDSPPRVASVHSGKTDSGLRELQR